MKFRKDLPEAGSGKTFVKLKDKESIQGIFIGDIHEFFTVWENGKSRVVPEGTPKAGFRFRINFIVKEGAAYVPKIFENGPTLYSQLSDLHDEYGLENIVVKITRNGTGLDTTYTIMPLIKQQVTKDLAAHLATIELLKLEDKDSSGAANAGVDDLPF
ncbi:MAG: hypothetical protein AB7H97_04020 [Pseudobdellovibrionaceae bacterium]